MSIPRQIFAANFRVRTGHDYLQGHLHRIGVVDAPDCPICHTSKIMNFSHLTICVSLASVILPTDNYLSKAVLYWAARGKMADNAYSST